MSPFSWPINTAAAPTAAVSAMLLQLQARQEQLQHTLDDARARLAELLPCAASPGVDELVLPPQQLKQLGKQQQQQQQPQRHQKQQQGQQQQQQ